MKKMFVVGTSLVVIVVAFAIGVNLYNRSESERIGFLAQENASLFVRDYSPTDGAEDASVFLVEFLDPECESCRAFYPYVKQLMADYKEKVKLVVRYAPFHKNSIHAVKVLEATREQKLYWESLEILFATQPAWAAHHDPRPELVWTILPDVGVDIEKAKRDMNDPKIEARINQDIEDGKALGVKSTPTFFVNGRPLLEFSPEQLRRLIEDEIKTAATE